MVVKGTTGSKELSGAIDRCAGAVRTWSFAGRTMDTGGHPVCSDKELSDSDQEKYNLILLGGVRENGIVDDIAADLAVALKKDSVTIGTEPVSLSGRGSWIVQKNPAYPERLVWIWASSEPAFFSAQADWIGDWRFPAEDPPDVLVYDVATGRYERAVHLTQNWQPEPADISSPVLTNCMSSAAGMVELYAEALCKATGCDTVWIANTASRECESLTHLRTSEAARLLFKHSMAMVCTIPGGTINELSRQKQKTPASAAGVLYPDPGIVDEGVAIRVAVLPHSLKSLATASRFSLSDVQYITAPLHDIFTRVIRLNSTRELIRETK
jgi:hypothetical protein